MIASLADHGIARTRWDSGPAGCFAFRLVARARRALVLASGAALLAGCGVGAPVVTVENGSPWVVDSLWVVTTADSTHVPTLAPGASARVRVHAQGEDLVVLRGHASGHALAPSLGSYVEASGRYRLRARVGASGDVTVVETRVGGEAY